MRAIERWFPKLSAASAQRKAKTAIATLRREFDVAPNFQEAEAARFIASFQPTYRGHFWSAPSGLFADSTNLQLTFDTIYSRSVWGSGSGGGSELQVALLYVSYIQHFLDRYAIRSIVDLGCGDWRFSKYLDLTGRNYLGLDIVPSVIAANQQAYGSETISFRMADLTQFEVGECDLLLCKDVLQHLSNKNVKAVLERSRKARFALFTNDYHPANDDSLDGSTRPLDITRPPFGIDATPRLAFSNKVTFLAASRT